jgi:hypothetical protein
MSQPLDQTPATCEGLGAWTHKETRLMVTYEQQIEHHNLTKEALRAATGKLAL